MQRGVKKRKFFIVKNRVASQAPGFELLNGSRLFGGPGTFWPPDGRRGFRDYPERPVFLADAKEGRLHWDLEEYSGYWFISEKMKSVLDATDPEAFAYLQCEVRNPVGEPQPVRWLCDVVRVLDALDEAQSEAKVSAATDGSKIYLPVYNSKLIFRESIIGDSHIFRMKYAVQTIICDEESRNGCKAADLKGLSFDDPSK
jgi:hypothetical protein